MRGGATVPRAWSPRSSRTGSVIVLRCLILDDLGVGLSTLRASCFESLRLRGRRRPPSTGRGEARRSTADTRGRTSCSVDITRLGERERAASDLVPGSSPRSPMALARTSSCSRRATPAGPCRTGRREALPRVLVQRRICQPLLSATCCAGPSGIVVSRRRSARARVKPRVIATPGDVRTAAQTYGEHRHRADAGRPSVYTQRMDRPPHNGSSRSLGWRRLCHPSGPSSDARRRCATARGIRRTC
jgi:hypothetical protein